MWLKRSLRWWHIYLVSNMKQNEPWNGSQGVDKHFSATVLLNHNQGSGMDTHSDTDPDNVSDTKTRAPFGTCGSNTERQICMSRICIVSCIIN